MYYEWDKKKARRLLVSRLLAKWLVVIAALALPILMGTNALIF